MKKSLLYAYACFAVFLPSVGDVVSNNDKVFAAKEEEGTYIAIAENSPVVVTDVKLADTVEMAPREEIFGTFVYKRTGNYND